MNARSRIYIIIALSIGIIFLIIAIVQNQMDVLSNIKNFTESELQDFLDGYVNGFPKPWE